MGIRQAVGETHTDSCGPPPVSYHPVVRELFDPARVHEENDARRARGRPPIYLPTVVGALREIGGRRLGNGPKRVYAYLVGRAGQNGCCWPSFDSIAAELGKCPRQIRSDVKVLEEVGLLVHENRAGRKSNTYGFVWHEVFERQWTAT